MAAFIVSSCTASLLYGANPLPSIAITADRAQLVENEFIPARVTITRTGALDVPLRVFLQQSGTARTEFDFTGVPAEAAFAPGQASVTYPVWPIDNFEAAPDKNLTLTITAPLQPFSIALIPDTQYYTSPVLGGVPKMFTAQTDWIVNNEAEWNIAFALHEGDCTDQNTPPEWQRAKASMSILDGRVPYAIAVGNHDGLMTSRTDTDLFNQYFPLANYSNLTTFGQPFERNRMDNVYHTFTAGGIDWLVLALEFGPRDEVLDWANTVVAQNASRKVMIVTHTHIYSDSTLHGSDPTHLWAPSSYGRVNNGVEVWEKLVRKHANIAFVFNGHVLNLGQGRLVGVGDHGNRVYQMLCNYQMAVNGGDGYMRMLKFFPAEDRFEGRSFSPYTGVNLQDPWNSFSYTNTGIFTAVSNTYVVDRTFRSVSINIVNDDVDRRPPAITSVSAQGAPAEILASFDKTLDPVTASAIGNYSVAGVLLSSARLLSGGLTVAITPSTPLSLGTIYSLSVTGVCDATPQLNPVAASQTFTYSPALLRDDFNDPRLPGWVTVDQGKLQAPSEWFTQNGKLYQVSNIHGPTRDALTNREGTFLVWDAPAALTWSNFTVSIRLQSYDDDGIGVLFRYSNPSNYYKLEMDAQRVFRKLTKTVDGRESLLACDTNAGYSVGAVYSLDVEANGPILRVQLDGRPALPEVIDDSLTTGTVALYSWGNFSAGFDSIQVLPVYSRPSAAIVAPGSNDVLFRGTNVLIELAIDDPDEWLHRVELLDSGRQLHTFSGPPFTLTLSNVQNHDFSLVARAVDRFGAFLDSPVVGWHVIDPVPPPTMVLQPQGKIIAEGGNVYFSGRAESLTGLRYQWRFNGTSLPNATNSFLLLEGVQEQQAGAYTLSAANISGATDSVPAILTVVKPTGSGTSSMNEPFKINVEALLNDWRAVLSVSAPRGATIQIESSEDLRDWTYLTALTNAGDHVYFTDTLDKPQRFYRARLVE